VLGITLTPSEKRAKKREQYGKIGQAISHYVIDPQAGITNPNPWRVIKGATGFFGMQIDNRPGLCRKLDEEVVNGD